MIPAAGAFDVALRDGSTVRVRPVQATDRAAMRAFLDGLSDEARYLRFFSAGVDVDRQALAASTVGPDTGYGLVASGGEPQRIVGHAEYFLEGRGHAEVAFEVAGERQGHGIATVLLALLAEHALDHGVQTFTATVLPSNHRMISVFRESGFAPEVTLRAGELQVAMPTELTAQGHARFEDRARATTAAAVAHVLRPASIAIVGAHGTVGGAVMSNLIGAGFTGRVAAVDLRGGELRGMPVNRSLREVPWPVELAVLAVPSKAVLDLARDCGEAGVRALVVLSTGFAETGAAGRRDQDELLSVCRGFGMRVVGPNCLGVLNTDDAVRLNATYAPHQPPSGRIAFASQSGAYGIAGIAEAARRGLGLSSFVSTGNKADLSGNDLLQYWEQDPGTDVVLLYLESFGNPRRFGTIARRVAASKPIVAVKSGRAVAGARATSSHTGALLATSDSAVDALFAHAGVIRTDTVAECFDVAALLAGQPVPPGARVAIVANAAGPAIACTDACAAAGVIAASDPVDLGVSATADDYRLALETLAADDDVDAIIAIFIPPVATEQADVAAAVRAVAPVIAAAGKPLVAVFMALPGSATTPGAGVPAFGTPEEAARALGHAVRYGRWRATADESPPALAGIDEDAAAALVAQRLSAGSGWLEPEDVDALLACYGIRRPAWRVARSAAAAGRCAAELGEPVAVKVLAPGLVHKSDVGAVRLGVRGVAATIRAARAAAADVRAAGHEPTGFLVQTMVPEGIEMLAGVVSDPDFGPVVACGAGGRAVELLGDVAVRLAPLTRRDAHEMVRGLRTFPLLDGYRGAPVCDVGALEDVLLRLSALAAARPEIAELDCDPVLVSPHGAVAVDARIRVAPPAPLRPHVALDR
jgi:acyl-CoA synthetase (NDP forming)/RimJ/RimL family protein N-acetyltransferase